MVLQYKAIHSLSFAAEPRCNSRQHFTMLIMLIYLQHHSGICKIELSQLTAYILSLNYEHKLSDSYSPNYYKHTQLTDYSQVKFANSDLIYYMPVYDLIRHSFPIHSILAVFAQPPHQYPADYKVVIKLMTHYRSLMYIHKQYAESRTIVVYS